VEAQASIYARVCAELRAGHKRSHWMWFIFPQLRGLGQSEMAYQYGIASREEAVSYCQHPLLGARLIECTELVSQVSDKSVEQIFGYPDHLKFHSSMTLFAHVATAPSVFAIALDQYFAGEVDRLTLDLLRRC
jgi:uncharacterized protein (DUF1810 family)